MSKMGKVNLILGLFATVLFFFMVWVSDPQAREYRAQRQQIALDQYQQSAAIYTDIKVLFVGALAVVVLVGLGVGIRVIYIRLGDRRYLAHLAHLQATQAMTIAYYDANRAPQSKLKTITYSPHISYQNFPQLAAQGEAMEVMGNPTSTALPSFQDVLATLSSGQLTFGFDVDNQPVKGSLNDLYSFSVGGLSGSGKTSTTVFLLAQAVQLGAKLIIIDRHAGNPESLATKLSPLASSFVTSPASNDADILAACDFIQDSFKRRQQGQPHYPLIVVADEFLALMRNDQLATAMQEIGEVLSQEARKYAIYGCFVSQKWTTSKVGDMSHTLTSHIVHRTRPELARYQTGLKGDELPNDLMMLDKGSYYLLNNQGDLLKLRAPYVSGDDLKTLGEPTSTVLPALQANLQADFKTLSRPALDPEKARVMEMFRSGTDVPEIVRTVYGVKGGKTYQDRSKEVNDLLRTHLA